MSSARLLAWWDALFAKLSAAHPRIAFLFTIVKAVGDREIPALVVALPVGVVGTKALFDWLMGELEAKASPWEKPLLYVLQSVVDAWLGTLTLPTP